VFVSRVSPFVLGQAKLLGGRQAALLGLLDTPSSPALGQAPPGTRPKPRPKSAGMARDFTPLGYTCPGAAAARHVQPPCAPPANWATGRVEYDRKPLHPAHKAPRPRSAGQIRDSASERKRVQRALLQEKVRLMEGSAAMVRRSGHVASLAGGPRARAEVVRRNGRRVGGDEGLRVDGLTAGLQPSPPQQGKWGGGTTR